MAAEDLRAPQVDLNAETPLLNDSFSHCQQAWENALNSLLCCLQTPSRKVSDLNELRNLAMQSFPKLDAFLEKIAHFSRYAVTLRYSSDVPDPKCVEVHVNYQKSSEFVSEIQQLIERSNAI